MSEHKHKWLKALAEQRGISVNKLIDELATIALTEQDARTWFEIRAKRGDAKRGLAILDTLDEHFGTTGRGRAKAR
ncbi:MAG: toxin-antitoxin system HicB family antitoxin [Nitrococcus sp.]|nr:toxin-antitoxin system HicB family antitoxin [Nitrococcus sp.]